MNNPTDYYNSMLSNPLTSFLAQVPRGKDLKDALREDLPPVPDDKVRQLPINARLRLLSVLRSIHIPLGRDLALAEFLIDMVEDSYVNRRPSAEQLQREEAALREFKRLNLRLTENDIEAIGGALIGLSGTGKTRTIRRILRFLRQVVIHDVNENKLLPPLSISWLLVECPSNRSLSALAAAIFSAVEQATKEPIPAKLKTGNESILIQNVAALCSRYALGMLVVDEIQHVLNGSGKPDTALLNFMVELSNRLQVPVLIIGTPLARKVVGGAMRQARRMLGPEWANLSREETAWQEFSQALISYQFTKDLAPFDSVEPTLYDFTQGLPGLAVPLWRVSQRYAILLESEDSEINCVTPEIIAAVYEDLFQSVRPIVDALRSGDADLIELYQDISLDTTDLDLELAKEAITEKEKLRMELFKVRRSALKKAKRIINSQAIKQAKPFMQLPDPSSPTEQPLLDAFDKAKEEGEDPGAAVVARA
jgi:hypothetical protein